MFHNRSWKPIYFWGQKVKVTKTLPAWVFALLWVLASSSSRTATISRTFSRLSWILNPNFIPKHNFMSLQPALRKIPSYLQRTGISKYGTVSSIVQVCSQKQAHNYSSKLPQLQHTVQYNADIALYTASCNNNRNADSTCSTLNTLTLHSSTFVFSYFAQSATSIEQNLTSV